MSQELALPLAPFRLSSADEKTRPNLGVRALVVDDDEATRDLLVRLLSRRGIRVVTAPDGRRALKLLEAGLDVDLALLDVKMPGMGGIEVLRRIRETNPTLPVVMVSGCEDFGTVTDAARLGVLDYVTKPFIADALDRAVDTALVESTRQPRHPAPLPKKTTLWHGPTLDRIRQQIEQIASTDAAVVIQGETGVGKELVARAIHEASDRAMKPYVKVNCACLPNQLIEAELFGHEKGSFTDAWTQKRGKFELAHGGTIFLDEIFEIAIETQPKLLQVLQDREVYRIGSNVALPVDARIVCATHRHLEQMVKEGRFRADLFYRINVVQIHVPPLRERREEIPALMDMFLRDYASRYNRPVPSLSPRVRHYLERARFPGNVRELENLARRIVVLGQANIQLHDWSGPETCLADELAETAGDVPLLEVGRRVAAEVERRLIAGALAETGWNRRESARRLGISYSTMLQKIKELGIDSGHGDDRKTA